MLGGSRRGKGDGEESESVAGAIGKREEGIWHGSMNFSPR